MKSAAALSLLLLAGQMAGVDPADVRAPAVTGTQARGCEAGAVARPVLRLPLVEVDREQARATEWHDAGRTRLGFIAAMGPENLWMKVRQGRVSKAWSYPDLVSGVEAVFDYERFRFVIENGVMRAYPVAAPQTPQARVTVPAALRNIYMAAAQVLITPVQYAVLHEDGSAAPESVSLLRQDRAHEYFVRVSESVREYLGNRYQFFALDLTSQELLDEVRDRPTPGMDLPQVQQILKDADLVKFARLSPSDEMASRAIDNAFSLVENTRARAEASEATG